MTISRTIARRNAAVDGDTGACSFSLAGVPAGRGKGEIVVTFADDAVRTYPSAAPFDLIVRAAL